MFRKEDYYYYISWQFKKKPYLFAHNAVQGTIKILNKCCLNDFFSECIFTAIIIITPLIAMKITYTVDQ